MEFSAGGIVYKKETDQIKILLILDSYGKWTFPKGHIEKKEKPEVAALREVQEETGLENLQIEKLVKKIDYWFKLNDELIHKFVYFYLMQISNEAKITIQTEEIADAKWFQPEDALKTIGYKEDIKLIKEVLDLLHI